MIAPTIRRYCRIFVQQYKNEPQTERARRPDIVPRFYSRGSSLVPDQRPQTYVRNNSFDISSLHHTRHTVAVNGCVCSTLSYLYYNVRASCGCV